MSSVLVLAAVPCLLLAGLLALMKVPANVQLTVTDSALVIEPQGLDTWWTHRRRVEVPLPAVSSIRIVPRSEAPPVASRRGLHRSGMTLAGVITAGTHGDAFWDVRRGELLLMISCHPDAEFRTLVLQLANPFSTLTRTRTVLRVKTGRRGTTV